MEEPQVPDVRSPFPRGFFDYCSGVPRLDAARTGHSGWRMRSSSAQVTASARTALRALRDEGGAGRRCGNVRRRTSATARGMKVGLS
jgi:hypothetical protein